MFQFSELDDESKRIIASCCPDDDQEEHCGLVVRKGGTTAILECRNMAAAENRKSFFRIDPSAFETAEDSGGEVLATWHSHWSGTSKPSVEDKSYTEEIQIPAVIYAVLLKEWGFYVPHGWMAPLENRPWAHGTLDCYGLVRDYYWEILQVDLPDFERKDNWWFEGGNLYLDNLSKAGFSRVPELKTHDAILMQILGSPVPNHVGVYLGDGVMLHHLLEKVSCKQVYFPAFGYFADRTVGYYRHESQMHL